MEGLIRGLAVPVLSEISQQVAFGMLHLFFPILFLLILGTLSKYTQKVGPNITTRMHHCDESMPIEYTSRQSPHPSQKNSVPVTFFHDAQSVDKVEEVCTNKAIEPSQVVQSVVVGIQSHMRTNQSSKPDTKAVVLPSYSSCPSPRSALRNTTLTPV